MKYHNEANIKSKPLMILKTGFLCVMVTLYYVLSPFILRGKVYFYRSPKMKTLEWLGSFALNFPVLEKLSKNCFAKFKFEITYGW